MDLCKYCSSSVVDISAEGLKCIKCGSWVHMTCLKRGSVPGGLLGDVFFKFTCFDCGVQGEKFERERMPWFQAITLVLYHVNLKTPGLARKGYFHWKMHVGTLIDKHWEILFPKDTKRKKKWIGTISGRLSHYSPHFFYSGTSTFNEPGWWTLTFPKLTPHVIVKLNAEFLIRKQKLKVAQMQDIEIVTEILSEMNYDPEYTVSVFNVSNDTQAIMESEGTPDEILDINFIEETKEIKKELKVIKTEKPRKHLLPTLETFSEAGPKKMFKFNNGTGGHATVKPKVVEPPVKFMNPLCHYNTSLKDLSEIKGVYVRTKLLGGMREETILSPYSSLYLKPYIRRDGEVTPTWLKLMAQVMLRANRNNINYKLPKRTCLDYVYVQPSHIPAVNSLCNQFFWPGIDLTDCLQYPDFSCIVLYKRLIVGFAFVVPDVKVHENYISFVFVRPGWRNVGIAKFMIYHLVQTSTGKDVTLHVSINNSALFLYQKFGFKVEHVEQNFYDKYYRRDAKESKHAFFCRLER